MHVLWITHRKCPQTTIACTYKVAVHSGGVIELLVSGLLSLSVHVFVYACTYGLLCYNSTVSFICFLMADLL